MALKNSIPEGEQPFITKRDGFFGSGIVFLLAGAYSLFSGKFFSAPISYENSTELWAFATLVVFLLAVYCFREYTRLKK